MFDPSVEQIIATGVSVAFTTAVGTACWCIRDRRSLKSKLAIMDKRTQNRLVLEGERKKHRHRQVDRQRPPPR
jgi:hypothetical protein